MGAIDPATQAAGRPVSSVDQAAAEWCVHDLLEHLGEDMNRAGLRDTPARFVRALRELTTGYAMDPGEILATQFAEVCDEIVIVKDIPFVSMCEHHLMLFTGHATVGYIPTGNRVVGLSKIARLVECFARRLQVQERMTHQIATAIEEHLNPLGVGVLVRGHHSCMAARGVRAPAEMRTSAMLGAMRDSAREEFLTLAS